MNHPIVVAVTGASGAVYARRLVDVLLASGRDVHVVVSPAGHEVLMHELGMDDAGDANKSIVPKSYIDAYMLRVRREFAERAHFHHYQDFMAPVASGSHLTDGMVVCPCSGTTLSAIATGLASNLIQRAAEVHLKERRKLILVPRETPLSLTHIDNMRRATQAGAIILPASPGFYHNEQTIDDLVDFVAARICDQLGVKHSLTKRWGEEKRGAK